MELTREMDGKYNLDFLSLLSGNHQNPLQGLSEWGAISGPPSVMRGKDKWESTVY
jgi:hypothetical protein